MVQQLALLPLREVDADPENAEPVSTPRGAGRPPGAKNKSTKAWTEYILGRYSSPLVALAETYSRTVEDLAAALGLKNPSFEQRLDLFKLQLQCAKELSPYVHQKQPLAIEGGEHGLMTLIINSGQATPQQVEKAGSMSINFIEECRECGELEYCECRKQNQQVSGDDRGNSDVSHSDAVNQDAETKQETTSSTTD